MPELEDLKENQNLVRCEICNGLFYQNFSDDYICEKCCEESENYNDMMDNY